MQNIDDNMERRNTLQKSKDKKINRPRRQRYKNSSVNNILMLKINVKCKEYNAISP